MNLDKTPIMNVQNETPAINPWDANEKILENLPEKLSSLSDKSGKTGLKLP